MTEEPGVNKEGERIKCCTVCGETVVKEVVPPTQIVHTEGGPVVNNYVLPTCTQPGSYDSVVYCTECGEELSRETIVIPAIGHTEGEWIVTKEAEFGIEGEETLYCSICGEVMGTREIPAIKAILEAAEGTTTVVDKEKGIIYGLEEYIYSLEDFIEYEGGTIEYVETANGFGTGTVVNLMVDGEVYESYTIVIFGDLTGDGVIDTYDTATLAAIVNRDVEVDEDSAKSIASDIFVDGTSDTYDLAVLFAVVNGDITISQVPEIA